MQSDLIVQPIYLFCLNFNEFFKFRKISKTSDKRFALKCILAIRKYNFPLYFLVPLCTSFLFYKN